MIDMLDNMDYSSKLLNRIGDTISHEVKLVWGRDRASPSWPFPLSVGRGLWDREFVEKVVELFSGFDCEDISKRYAWPSRLSRFLMVFLRYSKLCGAEKSIVLPIVRKAYDALSILRHNPLCEDRTNILSGFKPTLKSEIECDIGRRINAVLYAIANLLYFILPNLGFEAHGPYIMGKSKLVVFSYHSMDPEFERTGLGALDVAFMLPKRAESRFFFSGRALIDFRTCIGAYVGGFTSLDRLLRVFRELSKKIKSMSNRELLERHMTIIFYTLSPLGDWRPPKDIYSKLSEFNFDNYEPSKYISIEELSSAYKV